MCPQDTATNIMKDIETYKKLLTPSGSDVTINTMQVRYIQYIYNNDTILIIQYNIGTIHTIKYNTGAIHTIQYRTQVFRLTQQYMNPRYQKTWPLKGAGGSSTWQKSKSSFLLFLTEGSVS